MWKMLFFTLRAFSGMPETQEFALTKFFVHDLKDGLD